MRVEFSRIWHSTRNTFVVDFGAATLHAANPVLNTTPLLVVYTPTDLRHYYTQIIDFCSYCTLAFLVFIKC